MNAPIEVRMNRHDLVAKVRAISVASYGIRSVVAVLEEIDMAVELDGEVRELTRHRPGLLDAVSGLSTSILDQIEEVREISGIDDCEIWHNVT